MKEKRFGLLVVAVYCILAAIFAGCTITESQSMSDKKLNAILKDDLKAITEDIKPENLADSVYYRITEKKVFHEGAYSIRAIVEFFFLKKARVKIVRKYRYHKRFKLWDRYYNKYHFIEEDSTNTD